jgi:hypothetical protein
MPELTNRREISAGSKISALVTAALLGGVACALPAFAATGADQIGSVTVCGTATGAPTATETATTSAPTSDPTATATGADTAGSTDTASTGTGTDPSASTSPSGPDTTTPSSTPTHPDCYTLPPSATASVVQTSAPTTAATIGATTTSQPSGPVIVPTNLPGSTFVYTDTPPGNTNVELPHGTISRAQIIDRAEQWLSEKVPYSQTSWWTDSDGTYRQDCSGYVSMAWDLNQNIDFWTGNLNTVSHTIDPSTLLPGDTLMSVEHTIIFAGWDDPQHTTFDFFEEAHPGTEARYVVDAPLTAYIDNGFSAFRYDGVLTSGTPLPANPVTGLDFAALSIGESELVPAGVSTLEPAPAPWQRLMPKERAVSPSASTTPKSELAALSMDPAGPAPMWALLATSLLAALALILTLVRNPRIVAGDPRNKVYRRRH